MSINGIVDNSCNICPAEQGAVLQGDHIHCFEPENCNSCQNLYEFFLVNGISEDDEETTCDGLKYFFND